MRSNVLLLVFTALFYLQNAFAQIPGASLPRDMQLLELDMARASYDLVKNPQNREKLLSIYLRLIERDCTAGDQKVSLDKRKLPFETDCNEFIKSALELNPNNSVAICAREGALTRACAGAKAGIDTSALPENPIDALEHYLDRPALPANTLPQGAEVSTPGSAAAEYRPDLGKLETATATLQEAIRMFQATGNETAKVKLIEEYEKYLDVICPAPLKVQRDRSFAAWRNNMPENCKSFGARLIEVDPDNKFAKCFTEGYLSKSCFEYVKELKQGPSSNTGSKKESFDKF